MGWNAHTNSLAFSPPGPRPKHSAQTLSNAAARREGWKEKLKKRGGAAGREERGRKKEILWSMEHSGACLLGASFMFVCASTCWYYLGRSSGWGVRRGFHCDQAGASLSLSPCYLFLASFQALFYQPDVLWTWWIYIWMSAWVFSGKVMTAVLHGLSKLF